MDKYVKVDIRDEHASSLDSGTRARVWLLVYWSAAVAAVAVVAAVAAAVDDWVSYKD